MKAIWSLLMGIAVTSANQLMDLKDSSTTDPQQPIDLADPVQAADEAQDLTCDDAPSAEEDAPQQLSDEQVEYYTNLLNPTPGGVIASISSDQIQGFKSDIVRIFKEELSSMVLLDDYYQVDMGALSVIEISISKEKVLNSTIEEKSTTISLDKQDDNTPAVTIQINNMSLAMHSNFELHSRPEWIHDEGQVDFEVKNFDLSVKLVPYQQDGHFQTQITDVQLEIKDFSADLKGKTDISSAVQVVLVHFKPFFIRDIKNNIGNKLTTSAQKALNDLLYSEDPIVDLGITGSYKGEPANLVFNVSLTQNPTGGDGYLSIPMNGTMAIRTKDHVMNFPVFNLPASANASKQLPTNLALPSWEEGRGIQFFISEYAMNSVLKAAHRIGLLSIRQELPLWFATSLFNNFEKAFEKTTNVTVVFEVSPGAEPELLLNKDEIAIIGKVQIRIMNPMNKALTAAYVYGGFEGKLSIDVSSNLTVKTKFESFKMKVSDVYPLFEDKATPEGIQKQLDSVHDIIFKAVNNGISEPFSMPMKMPFLEIKPSSAKKEIREKYVFLSGDSVIY